MRYIAVNNSCQTANLVNIGYLEAIKQIQPGYAKEWNTSRNWSRTWSGFINEIYGHSSIQMGHLSACSETGSTLRTLDLPGGDR